MIWHHAARRPGFRSLLSLPVFLFLAMPSAAQDEPKGVDSPRTQPSATADHEAVLLLQKTQGTADEIARVVEDLKSASGEDLVILRNRFDELLETQLADLGRLVKMRNDREKSGQDVTQLAIATQQQLKRLSRRLRAYIQQFEGDLRTEAATREALSAEEVELFEHTMAMRTGRLDSLYRHLVALSDDLVAARVPAEDEYAFIRQQLAERSEDLVELLAFTRKQLEQYREMAKRAPDNTQVQAQLFATEERFEANRASLVATIHMMKKMGMDYADLEVRALEVTGEVTPEALEVEVATGIVKRKLSQARNYLVDKGPELFVRLLVVLGILLAFWLLARLTRAIVRRVLSRSRLATSELLKQMIISWAGRLMFLVGLIIVLSELGINLGPVLAGLGIAGFVVGFALQDTLANFAAGAMILAYGPYDVGDYVEAAGITGQVKDMNLVSTRILTPDHQTLIVPNSKIWGDVIRNVTAQPTRRIDLVFGISYEDDIAQAERVLQEIVTAHELVLDDPAPVIKVHNLNDSSVDFIVRPWAKTEDYWNVHWDITRAVKERFDAEGISIPYPQRDVHLITGGEAGAPPARDS